MTKPSFFDGWTGRVPDGWPVEPLGGHAWIRARLGWKGLTADEYVEAGIPMLATPNIKGPDIDFRAANRITTARYEESPEIMLAIGDVLLTKDGSTIGIVNVVRELPEPATVNGSIAVATPSRALDSRYLYWVLASEPAQGVMRALKDGMGVPHLFQRDIRKMRVPLPELNTQRAIADFLDRETAQIDAFIAENEKLIALLTERRAASIARAVTRGLNPDAPLKPSGIDWLGDIPAHWAVQRLKTTTRSSKNGVWGEEPNGEDDLRCVRVADFDRHRQRIHDNDVTLRAVGASERAGRVLQRGDLLLEKSGGGEKSPVGFVVLYDRDHPAVCSNFVARVVLAEGMEPRFWTYVHGAMYRLRITERSLKQSTGIQNLDQSAYFDERVAVPPADEQKQIADFLDERVSRYDDALLCARQAIALARERRAALISAAVTGRLAVTA